MTTPAHLERTTAALAALVAASLALTACGDKDDDTGDGTGDGGTTTADGGTTGGADLATAEALWSEIAGYGSWPAAAGWEDVVATPGGVHGESVQIWVNDAAWAVIDAAAGGDLPDGAISVKEAFSDAEGTDLASIVAMKKVAGYDPDNGDWFWAKYGPDGTPELYGSVSGCYGCHSGGQDYLLHTTW